MKRVLVIVPFPMSEENLLQRKQQMNALKSRPDIEFDFRATRFAPSNYVSYHDLALADFSIADVGLRAQDEGFDAICVDSMSDSGINLLRSILDIPVIGPGRHAMLTALMLGEKFSLLAMWDRWSILYKKTIADLGIEARCASIRSIGVRPDNQALLQGKEDDIFPLLEETALKCVNEDGADVIILGSTTMHQSHAYLSSRLPVPVINPGPLTYRMVDIALSLGLSHSKAAYPAPLSPKTGLLRRIGDRGAAFAGSAT